MLELDKIYNEDCLEGMKQIPDGTIDAVICDLPYGVLNLEWDCLIPSDKLWEQYMRIIKPNGVIVLFGTEPFSSKLRLSNPKWYKYDYVWVKTKAGNFASCRHVPLKFHEIISVFYDKGITYNMPNLHRIKPIKNGRANKGAHAKQYDGGDIGYMQEESGFNESVLYYSNKSGEGYSFHPTQKPIDLIRELVLIYTNEGDTVLDNCMGSGTTAIACIKERRHFIGFELSKEYFDKAVRRIKAEQAQLTLF